MGRVMIDLIGVHRTNDAKVIGNRSHVRKQPTHSLSAFAISFELVLWPKALELFTL